MNYHEKSNIYLSHNWRGAKSAKTIFKTIQGNKLDGLKS